MAIYRISITKSSSLPVIMLKNTKTAGLKRGQKQLSRQMIQKLTLSRLDHLVYITLDLPMWASE